MERSLALLKKFDLLLLSLTFLLVAFGLAAIYSIALSQDVPDFANFYKQLGFFGIGTFFMVVFGLIDYRFWQSAAKVLYIISFLLLLSVLIFGQTIRGVTGWFVLAGYQFQPIELIKVFLLIVLAYVFSHAERPLNKTKNILWSFFLVFALFALTVVQPDLGSAMLLLLVWFGVIVIIGLSRWQWLALIGSGVVGSLLGWFFLLRDYQKERIISLFQPNADVLGEGYAVAQSIIAIGSGRLIGSGLGFGSQSQLKFLPESHTDFIFSVIAEELGFFGATLLVVFLGFFLVRMILLAKRVKDDFALFFLIGAVVLLFSQIFLNIGVTLGMLPVTGVTLPLISYGGSSLIATFMLLGIVQSIAARNV